MAATSLVVSFPANWFLEPEAELLWVDQRSEQHYTFLTQGKTVEQTTYAGHRWMVRSKVGREVLADVTVVDAPGGVQRVVADGAAGSSDVRLAVLRIGRCARELAAKTCHTLLKLLRNVVAAPHNEKFRSLRVANATIAVLLDAPGALALLAAVGFEQQGIPVGAAAEDARLFLHATAPLALVKDGIEALERLHLLLHGGSIPPPTPNAAPPTAVPSSSSDAASHRCAACGRGIDHDLRRALAGSGEVGGWRTHAFSRTGEYRFHCERCDIDLCGGCYDEWKRGGNRAASIHPISHSLTVVAPITTPWGGSSYGSMPAPPPVTSRNRRGAFG
jgi:hypothetical protein